MTIRYEWMGNECGERSHAQQIRRVNAHSLVGLSFAYGVARLSRVVNPCLGVLAPTSYISTSAHMTVKFFPGILHDVFNLSIIVDQSQDHPIFPN